MLLAVRPESEMTVHALPPRKLPSRKFLPLEVTLTAEIFRRLSEFREDYGEAILQSLFGLLRQHMSEEDADRIMSDALTLDNEIRFRLPCGLSMLSSGEDFLSTDEEALVALLGHVGDPDGAMAIAMAERLGIGSHQVLRECACGLARSLEHAGIRLDHRSPPPAMHAVPAMPAAPRLGPSP
jgi:hypothetical protein